MSKKHENVLRVLNYIDHSPIVTSTITYYYVFPFPLLFLWLELTASSKIGLKTCVITTAIKMYKSIIKKKRKKHNKIALLAKFKLNNIEVLISKALINSNINHNEFVLINDVLKEFYDMKEEIRYSNDK